MVWVCPVVAVTVGTLVGMPALAVFVTVRLTKGFKTFTSKLAGVQALVPEMLVPLALAIKFAVGLKVQFSKADSRVAPPMTLVILVAVNAGAPGVDTTERVTDFPSSTGFADARRTHAVSGGGSMETVPVHSLLPLIFSTWPKKVVVCIMDCDPSAISVLPPEAATRNSALRATTEPLVGVIVIEEFPPVQGTEVLENFRLHAGTANGST